MKKKDFSIKHEELRKELAAALGREPTEKEFSDFLTFLEVIKPHIIVSLVQFYFKK